MTYVVKAESAEQFRMALVNEFYRRLEHLPVRHNTLRAKAFNDGEIYQLKALIDFLQEVEITA